MLFRHIHAEVIAGVQIIQVQVIGNVLFVGIVKISLEFPIREKSADRLKPCFPFKLLFGEQKMIDLLERPSGFISLPYGSYVIGIAIRESEFISVTDEPFAECFVFGEFFEQGYILRIGAQTVFEQIFGLRVPFIYPQVGNNIPARIVLIRAVFILWDLGDNAPVDESGIRIVVFGIGDVPLAVLKFFLIGLQFFRKPADAVAITEIKVFHIFDKAFFGMYAVNGDLLAAPLLFLRRDRDGHFHEFFFPNSQISVISYHAFLPRVDFNIPFKNFVHDIFRNGFNIFFCHSFYLKSRISPKSSSRHASASVSKADISKAGAVSSVSVSISCTMPSLSI